MNISHELFLKIRSLRDEYLYENKGVSQNHRKKEVTLDQILILCFGKDRKCINYEDGFLIIPFYRSVKNNSGQAFLEKEIRIELKNGLNQQKKDVLQGLIEIIIEKNDTGKAVEVNENTFG